MSKRTDLTMTISHQRSKTVTADSLLKRTLFHLKYSRCKELNSATDYDKLESLTHAVRDLAMDTAPFAQLTRSEPILANSWAGRGKSDCQ